MTTNHTSVKADIIHGTNGELVITLEGGALEGSVPLEICNSFTDIASSPWHDKTNQGLEVVVTTTFYVKPRR